jgi:hypothetical protein
MTEEICNLEKDVPKGAIISTSSTIQRLSGKGKYTYIRTTNTTNTSISEEVQIKYKFPEPSEYGETVATEFGILCDLKNYKKMPRFSYFFGYVIGALVLGFGSDRGGRKMIILSSIWTTGIMSIFQIVGNDFISFVFFQFFIGLFIGVSCLIFGFS